MTTPADTHTAARIVLLNTIALLLETLRRPEAAQELGRLPPHGMLPGGARVVGTSYELPTPIAAQLMIGLATLQEAAPAGLLTALAEGDAAARAAVLKGTLPPLVESLYPQCAGIEVPEASGSWADAIERLSRVLEEMFPPGRIRKQFELLDRWFEQPIELDAMPLQKFIAQFVRNAPP